MKIYKGIPESPDYPHVGGVRVIVDGVDTGPLDPRTDLRNHSPTGFAWGYHGSGPAQLALAILADAFEDDELAQRVYQEFKSDMIAPIGPGEWEIALETVKEWARPRVVAAVENVS